MRWKGAFGFLTVALVDSMSVARTCDGCTSEEELPVAEQRSDPVRVYVHYKALQFVPPVMQLKRGDRVRVLLKRRDKGLFGVRVEALID